MTRFKNILVTGGAGYVGSVLVPKLLAMGYKVKVIDLYIYGEDVLDSVKNNYNLSQIKGDIRNKELLERELKDVDAVIHLACISNDPSYELNPELGKSINYDAFISLVDISKRCGIKRFIYASSSSVYGIKKEENVTEDMSLEPLTDYSKYKALCEDYLLKQRSGGFVVLVIRPATVCGYSPRQRFDLTVNILTNHAYNTNRITVFGGMQTRPNIHIKDITDLYCMLLELPDNQIAGKIYNAGYQNQSVADIAGIVRDVMKQEFPGRGNIEIATIESDDPRSYRISSEKIKKELNFVPKFTIEDGARDLIEAFRQGRFVDPMNNRRYYNIKTMKAIGLR